MDIQPPGGRTGWNTHIAALARVCAAAGLSVDTARVAGVTGLGFRTIVCSGAAPLSLYGAWSVPHYFSGWLPALGIDAAVLWHPAGAPGASCFLKRVRDLARQSLSKDLPVVYWDNLAFALLTATQGEQFVSNGISRGSVHPALADPATGASYVTRLVEESVPGPFAMGLTREELTSEINGDMFFACPLGVMETDTEAQTIAAITAISRELSGKLEYPRSQDAAGFRCDPQYGVDALERLVDELKQGKVHHFGLVQLIQSLAGARSLGTQFLSSAAGLFEDGIAPRLRQAAEFFARSAERWRFLAARYNLPLDPDEQTSSTSLRQCADVLYEIHRTEETAARLVHSVADELRG